MSNNALEKTKVSDENADLAPKIFGFAALGVMAAMFALMGFSMTIIIFLVLVGYFVWRAVARTELHEVRGVFEFYLQANEILRDDERRWYGFEIQDVITRGQRILAGMPDAPPLVHFALGALNARAGNFDAAEKHLAFVLESDAADEAKRLTASSELRSYVRILRKLEREPAEAPQTTAAIRALERSRRHRAAALLADVRRQTQEQIAAAKSKELIAATTQQVKPLLERLADPKPAPETIAPAVEQIKTFFAEADAKPTNGNGKPAPPSVVQDAPAAPATKTKETAAEKPARKRPKKEDKIHKSISEVLRDIYD